MFFHQSLESKYDEIISKVPICHRLPDRTFKIKGHYFPVCARCTGFYISAVSYFIYAYFYYVQYTSLSLVFALLMLVPTVIDGLTQLIDIRESNNMLRLFTGLMGGLGLAILIKTIKWVIVMGEIIPIT